MARIGDRVRVKIGGPNVLAGTATASGTARISQDEVVTRTGIIVEDLGDHWLVEFDEALFGAKRMVIPKSRVPSQLAQ